LKRAIIAIVSALVIAGALEAQVIRMQVPSPPFETATILYTANTKGLHAASQTDAPASAIQTIISAIREETKDSLLVDLGNFMGATPTTVLTQGAFDFQVMELRGYDLLHISSLSTGRIADPSNARLYPTEPSLLGLQLVSGSLDLRLDLTRMTYLTALKNFAELQYGLALDRDWIPSETVDTVEGLSQFSLNLSNLLFGGVKTLDPYVSADLQTVLLFPNPMNQNIDPSLPRPGSLKLATGLELTLFKILSLKTGVRWENQPFAPSIPATPGTEVFGAFDFQKLGITISPKTQVLFSLNDNVKLGPGFRLFYNSLVGHMAYVFDVPLILAVTF